MRNTKIKICLLSIFILGEDHLRKPCIWVICFHSYSPNICSKPSMFHSSFKSQTIKSSSGKRETIYKSSRRWAMTTLRILLLWASILKKLSYSLILSIWAQCIQMFVECKEILTWVLLEPFSDFSSLIIVGMLHILQFRQLPACPHVSHIFLERRTCHV